MKIEITTNKVISGTINVHTMDEETALHIAKYIWESNQKLKVEYTSTSTTYKSIGTKVLITETTTSSYTVNIPTDDEEKALKLAREIWEKHSPPEIRAITTSVAFKAIA